MSNQACGYECPKCHHCCTYIRRWSEDSERIQLECARCHHWFWVDPDEGVHGDVPPEWR